MVWGGVVYLALVLLPSLVVVACDSTPARLPGCLQATRVRAGGRGGGRGEGGGGVDIRRREECGCVSGKGVFDQLFGYLLVS